MEKNPSRLVERLRINSYYPQPVRRVEIPKDNGKTMLLSIYYNGDKFGQKALWRILEAVFEPVFYDEMMGFPPNRNCYMALRELNVMLERNYAKLMLGAGTKRFFDQFDHEWNIRFLESRKNDSIII